MLMKKMAHSDRRCGCLLGAIEPLQGKRFTKVYMQRTKKEYTLFMQDLEDV